MKNKAAKLILYTSLSITVLLTALLVWGCGSKTTQTTETTSSVSASNTGLNEWDIDSRLTQHLINSATTSHGKLVFANLVDRWVHGTFQLNQDGSWSAKMIIENTLVRGNTFLEPIFENPVNNEYTMEWRVSEDGLEFTPGNDNAIRLEAELAK